MTIKMPPQVKKLLNILEENGFEAYIVGGCVRDSIIGKPVHDWDVCTSALPEQIISCFHRYKVIETGLKHGTVTVIIDNENFEVTTYRIDGKYSDHRKPDQIEYTNSLYVDLSRRDFTINSMAYSPIRGFVDYFGGMNDLQSKTIRCVGDPKERFSEDSLRILRAMRFASVYDFKIEDTTKKEIHSLKSNLQYISAERINSELCKLICGNGVESILQEYSDVIGVFIPEILPTIGFNQNNPYHCFDVWKHTTKSVQCVPPVVSLRLTMLFHDISKPQCYSFDGVGHFYGHPLYSSKMSVEIMKRLKFDNKLIDLVSTLVLYHDSISIPNTKQIKRLLSKLGEDTLRLLVSVRKADIEAQSETGKDWRIKQLDEINECIDKVIEQQQCLHLKDLAINGGDLINLGFQQGTKIGQILNDLLVQVIDENLKNQRDILLQYINEKYL